MKSVCLQVYEEAADTELAKKGHAIGSQVCMCCTFEYNVVILSFLPVQLQFAKEVHKTAGEVAKTDVGQAVKKVKS